MNLIKNFIEKWKLNHTEIQPQITQNLLQNVKLLPHQTQGVKWLIQLYITGRNALLADQMGLGKTIQSVALLSYVMGHCKNRKSLIIAPLPLLENWQFELRRALPKCKLAKLNGSSQSKSVFNKYLQDPTLNIILISFSFIIAHSTYILSLSKKKIKFQLVFIDQVQKCKNQDSQTYKAIANIQCAMKILLTGTPFENKVKQMSVLFQLVQPKILKSKNIKDLGSEEYKLIIDFFMLRRLKSNINNSIPAKQQVVIYTKLTELQQKIYRQIKTHSKQVLSDSENVAMEWLNEIKICNHPLMFSNSNFVISQTIINCSGKMIQLDKILSKHILLKQKIIIFTQLLKTSQILQSYCLYKNYTFTSFNGKIPSIQRNENISRFKFSDVQILIMTTKAGGVGLNLTEANIVILYDSNWNPQIDKQAIARCHRIGQKKQVIIYRLICQNTIEEKIFKQQLNKMQKEQELIEIDELQKNYLKDHLNQELLNKQDRYWGTKMKDQIQILPQRLRKKGRIRFQDFSDSQQNEDNIIQSYC